MCVIKATYTLIFLLHLGFLTIFCHSVCALTSLSDGRQDHTNKTASIQPLLPEGPAPKTAHFLLSVAHMCLVTWHGSLTVGDAIQPIIAFTIPN